MPGNSNRDTAEWLALLGGGWGWVEGCGASSYRALLPGELEWLSRWNGDARSKQLAFTNGSAILSENGGTVAKSQKTVQAVHGAKLQRALLIARDLPVALSASRLVDSECHTSVAVQSGNQPRAKLTPAGALIWPI